jgi:hypothetical protein
MPATNDQPDQAPVPLEKEKNPGSSRGDDMWDGSGLAIAIGLVAALVIIGVAAERSLNYWAPIKPGPTSAAVSGQADSTSKAAAAPKVYMDQAKGPRPAPGLPPSMLLKTN